jgi:hypothetical protein
MALPSTVKVECYNQRGPSIRPGQAKAGLGRGSALPIEARRRGAKMTKFLIESPHTAENCTMVIREVHSMGYLENFDWGCEAGVHCGWAIVDLDTPEEAEMMVPSIVRSAARVVPLVKFGRARGQELHEG